MDNPSEMAKEVSVKKFEHMDDVVVTAMDRTGMASLRQISRLRENYTEAAEKTPFGKIARVNQYSVVAELGKGSYGAVYLVEDGNTTEDSRYYAMKSFPSSKITKPRGLVRGPRGATANNVDVVKMEIAIMKKLAHPNLVRLSEVIEETEAPYSLYLIMDYVDGGQVMSLKPGLPEGADPEFIAPSTGTVYGEAQASRLFRQLLSAMKYLHANQIAHRDLKPDNILISLDGQIKVTDFGVSNDFANETRLSRKDGFVTDTKGTWPYWAPEMCDEDMHKYNAFVADVWAAGVCLYVFVFGKLPFWGQSCDDIFQKILSLQTHPLEYPSRRSPEFVEMLDGMLVANPAQRPTFADCEQFAWIQQHSDETIETRLNSASSRRINRDSDSFSLNNALTPGKVAFFSDNVNAKLSAWTRRASLNVNKRKSKSIEKVNNFIAESRIRTAAEIRGQEEEARRLDAPDAIPEVQRSVFSQVLQHLKFEKDEAKTQHKMNFVNVLGELKIEKNVKEQQKSVFSQVLQQFKFEKDVAKNEHKLQFANVLGELHSTQRSNKAEEEEDVASPRSVFSQVMNQIQRIMPDKVDKSDDNRDTPPTTHESSLKSIATSSSDDRKLSRMNSTDVTMHNSRFSNVLSNIRNSITRQPSCDPKAMPVLNTDVIVDLVDEVTLPEREIKKTASSPRLSVQSEHSSQENNDVPNNEKLPDMVSTQPSSTPAACCIVS